MEQSVTIYDTNTGVIKYVVTVPDYEVSAQGDPEDGKILGNYQNDRYRVDLNTLLAVPLEPINYTVNSLQVPADGLTPVIISELPIPTRVRWVYGSALVEDGEAEITFDTPGNYNITLSEELPLSLPVTLEVEVV
jgi:hypothetical protein